MVKIGREHVEASVERLVRPKTLATPNNRYSALRAPFSGVGLASWAT